MHKFLTIILSFRSTFGGTVGPNINKSDNLHYYEGIKTRLQPLMITTQTIPVQQTQQQAVSSSTQVQNIAHMITKGVINRRPNIIKPTVQSVQNNTIQVIQTNIVSQPITESNVNDIMTTPPPSPASPILKAQLSAVFKKDSLLETPTSQVIRFLPLQGV